MLRSVVRDRRNVEPQAWGAVAPRSLDWTPQPGPPVLPGDDDLVVVPLLDVAEVGDDGELELVGLPLAAQPLLDGLAADHQPRGRGDPHQAGHVGRFGVGVVRLDRLDEGPVLLGLLEVDPDGAGLVFVVHVRAPSVVGTGTPDRSATRPARRSSARRRQGCCPSRRARRSLGEVRTASADARVPAGDDLAERLAVRLAVARGRRSRPCTGRRATCAGRRTSRRSAGRPGCRGRPPEQGPLVEVGVEQGVERLVGRSRRTSADRPVALDQQLLDEPAQALQLRRVEPVLLGLAERVGRATGERQPDEAEQLGVADPVEGGVRRPPG